MTPSFEGKKAVIIGGSAGIGLAVAKQLSALGAEIVIASRSQERLAAAAEEIGGAAQALPLDVTDEAAIRAFFEQIGPFDHLATPAAGGTVGMFLESDPAEARALIESKLWGQYFAARYGAPKLRDGGSITFFSGIVARKPLPGATAFTLVAGAMESFTRALALELAPLRVNCVTPGVIETGIWGEMLTDAGAEEHLATVGNTLPVGRTGRAEEVAQAVVYLMGNAFATGSVIDVDGGHRVV